MEVINRQTVQSRVSLFTKKFIKGRAGFLEGREFTVPESLQTGWVPLVSVMSNALPNSESILPEEIDFPASLISGSKIPS